MFIEKINSWNYNIIGYKEFEPYISLEVKIENMKYRLILLN